MSDPFPPPNPSLRWFRVVLWLMPTCIAFPTLFVLEPLASMVGGPVGPWLFGWGMTNLVTTYVLGMFDQKLKPSTQPPDDVFPPEAQFLILQLILVPFLSLVSWLIRSAIP